MDGLEGHSPHFRIKGGLFSTRRGFLILFLNSYIVQPLKTAILFENKSGIIINSIITFNIITQLTQPDIKDKRKERVAELTKKKNSCYNCGSIDHNSNNCPKEKKEVYAIEKVPEEESPTEDFNSDSMGDAIREPSDDYQGQEEGFLVEYKEETKHKIQDIQLLAVTPTKGMTYIHGKATKMTVFIENAQNTLICESGVHCSIVARNYLDHHSPNWENLLLPTQAKNFKSASGKITSIGRIIKEIILTHRKGNIRPNPEFVELEDAHIQGFLMATDYQRMYSIDIYNSKNRNITIGTNKEKELLLDMYQMSTLEPLVELLNQFKEVQFSPTSPPNQNLVY
ncbi:hypothetical protein O181_014085 [Austropuccinia psidii MF-1]|uniref:CCHC-type domain-containing protein n=1 Tax=Austropuccinia psidii MF-1 TaxID=1389203 RepID=A0A9Q3GPK7_9BASI|nr:hypothetical protein [Austropuccinia psidii MF-1]